MPALKLVEATHVAGILTNAPDDRGQLVVVAVTTTGARIPVTLTVN